MIAHSGVDHLAIGLGGAVAVGVYGAAWLASPRRVAWRLWSWTAGIVLLVAASTPAFERLAEERFTGHMVQHLLVIVGAAPLLVLSRPLHTAMAAGWIPATALGRRVGTAWHRAGPLLGPALFVVVLFATHLTSVYDRALGDRLVHEVEHAAYLLGAVAMWAAVLGVGRSAAVARIGSVFGVIAGGALLGMILLSATAPLVPTYEIRLGSEVALDDQRAAAAIMWVTGMLTTLPLLVLAVWRWAATEERIARRAEVLAAAAPDVSVLRDRPDPIDREGQKRIRR